MENKQISILLIAIAVLTISVMSVMASVTVVSPGASATVSGIYKLNASGNQLVNCTFYAKSSNTANSSWTVLNTTINLTAGQSYNNGTFRSSILEDGNDYIINATCDDENETLHLGTVSGITIDNSVPTTPTITPASETRDTDGDVTFTGTVNGSQTTGCTLYFDGINPGNPSYTMTHSGSTCTYTKSAMSEQTYKWYVQATDGKDTSNSATNTIIVDTNTGGAKGGALWYLDQNKQDDTQTLSVASQGDSNKTATIVVIILVIVTIAVVINRKR